MARSDDAAALARLEQLSQQAGRYVDAAKAKAIVRAYRSDCAEFSASADHRNLVALPATPETLSLYLVELAEVAKASTIARRFSSIRQAHCAAGQPSPTMSARVKAVAAGIRRVHGTAVDQAAPVTVAILRRMLEVAPPGLAGTRDQALLLKGFAGALRRSEIVALHAEHPPPRPSSPTTWWSSPSITPAATITKPSVPKSAVALGQSSNPTRGLLFS